MRRRAGCILLGALIGGAAFFAVYYAYGVVPGQFWRSVAVPTFFGLCAGGLLGDAYARRRSGVRGNVTDGGQKDDERSVSGEG